MPSAALPFELFGMKFFEKSKDKDNDTIGEPQHYTIAFNVVPTVPTVAKASHGRALERILEAASTLWTDRKKPASGAAGLLAKARGDYKTLLATLYGEARYGGTISILVDGREAATLPPDTTLPDPAKVVVSIDPGPAFLFSRTSIVNQAPPPALRGDRVETPAHAGFRPGELARSGTVLKADRLSIEAWRQQGYAKAKVTEQNVVADHASDTIDATLTVEPGRKAYYGVVSVHGTERMDPAFVAWATGLKEGREYDPDEIERANKRLQRLDVFRSARIEEAPAIEPSGLLPLGLTVQERPLHRFGIGADYSTLDGAGLNAYWLQRDLFGHAESIKIEGRVAGIGASSRAAADIRDLTYRAGITYTRPAIYTPDTDFSASIIGDREVLDQYTRNSITGTVGFTEAFTPRWSGKLFAEGGPSHFEDDFGSRNFAYAGLLGGLTYDGRDNAADATEGVYADFQAEPYYEFDYGNPTLRVTAEGRGYYGLGEDKRVVLAGRVKIGSVIGPPLLEAAPDKLFFAGGGGSVRGYAYRNIGVILPDGRVSGGRSLIEASGEIRTRITDTIGLVAFADAGLVGPESFPDFSQRFRVGVGGGLRYLTGLGPLRLDVAVPLERQRHDPSVAFYVGLGQAF